MKGNKKMSGIEIIAVAAIIGYVIFRQVQGEPVRGKRAVRLPAILTIVGLVNLRSGGARFTAADTRWLVIGIAGSAAIGLAFGVIMRLESRGGQLWAQLPLRGLWLWAALIGWRLVVTLLATDMHAHLAASSATLLLSLGVNRLAQAVVIAARAMAMGVPFAPEKDGRVFMADTFNRGWLGSGGASRDRGYGGYDFDDDGYQAAGRSDLGRRPRRQSWDR
jgi:hypothetical protein